MRLHLAHGLHLLLLLHTGGTLAILSQNSAVLATRPKRLILTRRGRNNGRLGVSLILTGGVKAGVGFESIGEEVAKYLGYLADHAAFGLRCLLRKGVEGGSEFHVCVFSEPVH